MAYSTAGEKRVNYYSSPLIKYQGYATGTSTADNARTLVENRFAVAAIGDESMSCSGTSASVTSPPTSVTLPPTSVTSPQTTTVSSSCVDKFSNCKDYINQCWHPDVSSGCQLTCRLCPGMTPVSSTVCFDRYSNCVSLARAGYCYSQRVYESCSSACGLC
ncbi:uncharacterized protein LOC111712609 [Eurytemora carolleeae]|uniref:uncharacterized protein LOC111712609 n=1 Tax=Eurytemora carolleeae TaxID=1294199 RepID=UPI000C77AF85|nr:uncharacterized protein LOC111712609 [Eurytemora carolleeae]|eukprot:XP_023343033.1 uncharacterized protein LOC111712609 [Eurytemora affinis]